MMRTTIGAARRYAWLARPVHALREWLADRRATACLGGLDDRMLKDIGLYRCNVDPGSLRSVARERNARTPSR